jgi:hypothetical protein
MQEDKDNTRKFITFVLVSIGALLMSYMAVQIPESRKEAVVAISNWVTMVLVWYFAGKTRS